MKAARRDGRPHSRLMGKTETFLASNRGTHWIVQSRAYNPPCQTNKKQTTCLYSSMDILFIFIIEGRRILNSCYRGEDVVGADFVADVKVIDSIIVRESNWEGVVIDLIISFLRLGRETNSLWRFSVPPSLLVKIFQRIHTKCCFVCRGSEVEWSGVE